MVVPVPDEIVEEIKSKNDIIDIIGEYVQLKKQGRNYFGLCPFHNENTPSFSVTQDKQFFRCFGCGKGGTVFNFIMEIESMSFREAVSFLGERIGVDIPEDYRNVEQFSNEDQNLLTAFEWLTKLYHHTLRYQKEGEKALEYVENRGLNYEVIETFSLGYAPLLDGFVPEFLQKKGFNQQMLVKTGLLSINEDNNIINPFKGRVIFPIRNHIGKTVAFGGRSINEQKPKYLNSPENSLFSKSKILYNFDLAKKHIRKQNEVVLFEGYMDVISAYQADLKNVIASLGTALTEFQAKIIRRYVDTVIICYDDDDAGMNASFKAGKLLRKIGCNVKVARLGNGHDPDTFVQTFGAEKFKSKVIDVPLTWLAFYMQYMKRNYNMNQTDGYHAYLNDVLEQIAGLKTSIDREHYLKILSKESNYSIEALRTDMQAYAKKMNINKDKVDRFSYTNKQKMYRPKERSLTAIEKAERYLLAYMLNDHSIANQVETKIGASFSIESHKIMATHLYAFYEAGNQPNISTFLNKLNDESLKTVVTEIAMMDIDDDYHEDVINDYIHYIEKEIEKRPNLNSLLEEQRIAEQQNDQKKAAEIGNQIILLQRQLKYTHR